MTCLSLQTISSIDVSQILFKPETFMAVPDVRWGRFFRLPSPFSFTVFHAIVLAEAARVAPDESAFSPVRAASIFPWRSVTEKGRIAC